MRSQVFCDVRAYVSCRGYDGILQSAHFVNQGGTAGNVYDPSLTEEDSVMGGFFVTFSEPMAR